MKKVEAKKETKPVNDTKVEITVSKNETTKPVNTTKIEIKQPKIETKVEIKKEESQELQLLRQKVKDLETQKLIEIEKQKMKQKELEVKFEKDRALELEMQLKEAQSMVQKTKFVVQPEENESPFKNYVDKQIDENITSVAQT